MRMDLVDRVWVQLKFDAVADSTRWERKLNNQAWSRAHTCISISMHSNSLIDHKHSTFSWNFRFNAPPIVLSTKQVFFQRLNIFVALAIRRWVNCTRENEGDCVCVCMRFIIVSIAIVSLRFILSFHSLVERVFTPVVQVFACKQQLNRYPAIMYVNTKYGIRSLTIKANKKLMVLSGRAASHCVQSNSKCHHRSQLYPPKCSKP